MENLTPWQVLTLICGLLMAAAAAVNVLGSAAEKIVNAYKRAKAPNDKQNSRLEALEERADNIERMIDTFADQSKRLEDLEGKSQHHDKCLERDKKRLDKSDEDSRVTQRALLALLGHGLDGNNTDQMRRARDDLQDYLINR